MSLLNELINKVEDDADRERLQERMDLIQHKIKFMEKVPVACLDRENKVISHAGALLDAAGGMLLEEPLNARVLIYAEPGTGLVNLMGAVPALLQPQWPAVEYSRVYLWDNTAAVTGRAEDVLESLEDLAEMLYPGFFVFGNEGKTWIGFKTQ